MPTTSEFQPLGTAVGANVQTTADYLADAIRGTGYASGRASSAKVNKALRQGTLMAAVIGEFIRATLNQNVPDSGSVTGLAAQLVQALAFAGGGRFGVSGLVGLNDSVSPTTKYSLAAQQVATRNPVTGALSVFQNQAALLNNIAGSQAVSAAGGRDTAATFGAGATVHFYFISDGLSVVSTLSSLVAPSAGGPTLPSGYTAWAYATSLVLNGTALRTAYCRGARVFYATSAAVLSGGTAAGSPPTTAVSLSSYVPAIATEFRVLVSNRGGNPNYPHSIGLLALGFVSGATYLLFPSTVSGTNETDVMTLETTMPNLSQQLFYGYNGGDTNGCDIYALGYTVPNGG